MQFGTVDGGREMIVYYLYYSIVCGMRDVIVWRDPFNTRKSIQYRTEDSIGIHNDRMRWWLTNGEF